MPLSLRMGLGLTKARTGALPELLPSYVGFAHSKTGNPSMPAHQVGDLIIGGVVKAAQSSPSVSDANWTLWSTNSATGSAYAVYTKVAASTSEGFGTWSNVAGGRRFVYVFRNAQKGFIEGVVQLSGEAGTSVSWPQLNSGSAFTETHLGAAAICVGTVQVAITSLGPAAFTTDRVRELSSSTDSDVICDTGTASITSFATEADTLDTSSVHSLVVFTVKRA